jgi:hypothetical protein
MNQVDTKRYQLLIDLSFGFAFLSPIILYVTDILQYDAIFVSVGVGIGYMIHVTEKMLIFSDLIY